MPVDPITPPDDETNPETPETGDGGTPAGCGCSGGTPGAGALLLVVAVAIPLRRRRAFCRVLKHARNLIQ